MQQVSQFPVGELLSRMAGEDAEQQERSTASAFDSLSCPEVNFALAALGSLQHPSGHLVDQNVRLGQQRFLSPDQKVVLFPA